MICANYLLGSMAIYGAAAFSDFQAVHLFGTLIIVESLARSLSLLLSGRLGERVGRKRLFQVSVVAFGAMTIVAARAPSAEFFLWSRSMASFFWGLFQANVFTMIGERFADKEYPVRVGWLQTAGSLVLLVGPIVCGLLIQQWNWRVSMLGVLPLFVLSVILVGFFWPNDVKTPAAQHNQDQEGSDAAPPNHLRLFAQKQFLVIALITFLYTCISTSGNYIPLFAQTLLDASPTISSLILVPCNVLVMLFSNLTGVYIARHGCSKRVVLFMAGVGLTGSLVDTLTLVAPTYPVIILSTAVVGSGFGRSQGLPVSLGQRHVEKELVAEGTSFIVFIQGFSAVIAGGVYALSMNSRGLPFALAATVGYGLLLFGLAAWCYKEPAYINSVEENRDTKIIETTIEEDTQ